MHVFLFTDVESSTRLWEQFPDAMKGALARHDQILRDAVVGANGRVVKTTGDGLMAVFDSAPASVSACLGAQQGLMEAKWDTTGPLRVRMGINVGEADNRDGDFHGPAVNRTARIMAAGHGGQVLLSGSTAALAKSSLPPKTTLRDLGTHRLKDLTLPEHLFQLVHPDLISDFPPPATLDAKPNNLPLQVSEFFGRETELAATRAMLLEPNTRLVTLTGPGGTGKTRLALQVAAELVDQYRDGVFFVDLSAERTPDAAFEAILRDLGLSGSREGPPLQSLKVKLKDRNLLLVLDNFEQVTDAAVGVAELLQNCPELEVVATSREALRLRGEHIFPVPPLSLPDPRDRASVIAGSEAVSLFVERARSVNPGFALTEENAAAIAEICHRLDGLPLAIELAAARLRVFTPADLVDRLRQRIDVLGSGARDLPARQRTLRSTIEWSYQLLEQDECRVFELMSVFSTARLDAIEGVAGSVLGDIDVVELLGSLVEKSLVRTVESKETTRFSMLQTIRDYAGERLASDPGRLREAHLAHADFYTRYSSSLRRALEGPGRTAALDDLASEIGNLRAAWRFWVDAADLGQLYKLLDGLWALHDARGWYHAAIELNADLLRVLSTTEPSPGRDEEEMTLRISLARALSAVRGYTEEVEAQYKSALEMSSAAPTGATRLPVLRALATYYMNIAQFGEVVEMGRQLLDIAEREQNDAMRVEGHVVFGMGNAFIGDLDTGLHHLDLAIELFDPAMHGSGRFRVGTSPGVVARIASSLLLRQGGWPDRAIARNQDGLDLARKLNHPFSLAYALYHVGLFNLNRLRFEEVRPRAIELDAVAREHDYPVWRALASVLLGVADCGLGLAEEGLAMTEAGNDLYRGLTTPPVFWAPLLAVRGSAFAMAGRPHRALELVDEAIAAVGGNEADSPEFRNLRGDIIMMLPDADLAEAERSYMGARRGARVIQARLTELSALTRLVGLLRAQGRTPDGADELRALYETFTEGFDEPELVAARTILGST
jgi:predicted ATPase/class 3 adenylate cyclase